MSGPARSSFGKALVISLSVVGETEDDGSVRVFFELNGQPRVISVAKRGLTAQHSARRMADPTDENQIAAPMPGLVVTLAAQPGQKVRAGDLLLTLEAMKMETAINAPRDGAIIEIAVKAGQIVNAKELLAVIA